MLQKYWASTVIFIGIFSQCRHFSIIHFPVHRLCSIFPFWCQYYSCHLRQLSISNFPRIYRFSGSSFPMSSSGFPTLFLPIRFELASLSVTGFAFSQFVASDITRISYTRWHIPSIPLSLTVSVLTFSNLQFQFQFIYVMCTNCRIPNFLLVCFSASPFPVFIVPFPCGHIFILSFITRYSPQNVVFPEFSFNSKRLPVLSFTSIIFVLSYN